MVRRVPLHFWIGLGLVTLFWALNWSLPGLRTHWTFFPLWLGYALTVDGLVFMRKGNSLATRQPFGYAMLFFLSVPGWWLFELINLRAQNWFYLGAESFTPFEYALLASLSFSTVMPAIFGTAELAGTFGWLQRMKSGLRLAPGKRGQIAFFVAGWVMLALLLLLPNVFFPFLWISLYFILEPLNIWLKHPSLVDYTQKGDWRPVLALWLGALTCGFFWEFWNFYSYPKWIYRVPFVDFWRVFEMPLLGYGGYLPFALELYALFHLLTGALAIKRLQDYLKIV